MLQAGRDYLSALTQMASDARPQGKDRQKGLRDSFTQALRKTGHLQEDQNLSDDDFNLGLEFLKKNVATNSVLSTPLASVQRSEKKSADEFRSKVCGLYVWTSKQIEFLTNAITTLETSAPSSPALPQLRQAKQLFIQHRDAIRSKLSPESLRLITTVETINPENIQHVQTIFIHDEALGGTDPNSPAAQLFTATCLLAKNASSRILQEAYPKMPQGMQTEFGNPFSQSLMTATMLLKDAVGLCPNEVDRQSLEREVTSTLDLAMRLNKEFAI